MRESMFIKDVEYVFTGIVSNFRPVKIEKNMFGHFILGKFIWTSIILLSRKLLKFLRE